MLGLDHSDSNKHDHLPEVEEHLRAVEEVVGFPPNPEHHSSGREPPIREERLDH